MRSTSRPSIDETMMRIAQIVARRSTCPKGHVGAVIATAEGRILSLGYNGVPSGMAHCEDTGCQRDEDGKHLYLVHAEENAVANAAANGIKLVGSVAYVTMFPCSHCAAILAQAGVVKLICGSEKMSPAAVRVLSESHILVKGLEVWDG